LVLGAANGLRKDRLRISSQSCTTFRDSANCSRSC
jgi:hypothetical protein